MGASEPGQSTGQNRGAVPRGELVVDVTWRCDRWRDEVSEELLAGAARAAFAACDQDCGTAELSLLLCDDAEIRRLNRDWRGKNDSTNVLSFPLDGVPCAQGPRALGDVALAYGTVLREALQLGMPVHQHATHLVVHGVLHLMGYDHMGETDAREMETLETRILAELGLPDPYAPQLVANGEER